jgi:predicted nuclease of restriction endonuclease-like RecB superfamily
MLPSNLLVVNKRKGEIQPRYAKLSPENLKIADTLIEFYKNNIGKKKKVLITYVAELENQGYDYRFIRALSLLLDRKSHFTCDSKINPASLRKKIFQTAETQGIPTTPEKRQQIIKTVAFEMGISTETVEEQLYADLESELIFEKFEAPTALELLQRYNLSLTQTLLFECSELNFKVSDNWQKLFYTIKKLGLIYEVTQKDEVYVKIDGPSSLFKLTKRYGTNIAKLLPVIITNQEWTINAKILWKYTNEICDFKIEHTKHSTLLRIPNFQQATYDSIDEENFANQFKAVNSGWQLKREPEPVLAGHQVIVPDFSLEKAGLKIYLEIIGFWTEEYLQRKAEKLKHINVKMLLIVREALACEKLSALEKRPQLHFIYYRDKIPLSPILQYLQKEFEEIKTKEIELLQEMQIKFTEPLLTYEEFANRIGVSTESVQTVLTANPPTNYIPTTNELISKEKLQQIATKLNNALKQTGKLTLTQATTIIEKEGTNDITNILEHLTYKIKWHGINSDQAEIIPTSKTNEPTK